MEGYQVTTLDEVVGIADIFVTATGNKDIITAADMSRMKHNAIVGNIGHFDNEIDMAGLTATPGIKRINIKPQVDEWKFSDGHSVIVLAEGRLLNLGCATGHPSFVMSASFTNQIMAQIELFTNTQAYENKVYVLPKRLDEKVARLHLDKLGVRLTELSPSQADVPRRPRRGPLQSRPLPLLSFRRPCVIWRRPGSRRVFPRKREAPTLRFFTPRLLHVMYPRNCRITCKSRGVKAMSTATMLAIALLVLTGCSHSTRKDASALTADLHGIQAPAGASETLTFEKPGLCDDGAAIVPAESTMTYVLEATPDEAKTKFSAAIAAGGWQARNLPEPGEVVHTAVTRFLKRMSGSMVVEIAPEDERKTTVTLIERDPTGC